MINRLRIYGPSSESDDRQQCHSEKGKMHGDTLSALRELLVLNNQKRTYLIVIPETMKQYVQTSI